MQNEKVLIVEDDPDARKQLAKFISKEGFNVVEAEDAKIGLEKIDAEKPDIIITDLKMPHGDGLQIIRHAKSVVPFSQAILITAFGELEIAITAFREGVLDYLRKPLDLDALTLALRRAQEKIREYKKNTPFPTLLIAEDDEDTRTLLAYALRKEKWDVLEAKDGEEAVSLFKEKKIDVVVLDAKMPKKDGWSALHEMRKLSQDFETIIVTGYGDEEIVIKALHEGAINFVKKPVDLNQLVFFLQKALAELNLKRSLKYRNRELELSKNVIARLATGKDVIFLDFLASKKNASPNLALAILDLLPMGLILVTQNKEIRYVNKPVAAALQGQADQLDESFVGKLAGIGIRELPFVELISVMDKIFTEEEGAVETIHIGKWAHITLVKLLLIQNEKREAVVLMVLRGERGG